MKHKSLPKTTRINVYNKYNGHCAYCGCELEYKDMQVDHVKSVYLNSVEESSKIYEETGKHVIIDDGSTQDDSIDNLMPSCRQCNYYKAESDIEGFRQKIHNWLERTCVDSFQVRLAMKYGIIQYKPWDGKFYFEKC